jgi:hypothetical protein
LASPSTRKTVVEHVTEDTFRFSVTITATPLPLEFT